MKKRKYSTKNPLVSIVMPVYNAESYLKQALESIIAQTYRNWELIAVDDGSTDSSAEILKKYAKNYKRIRIYFNRRNLGIGRTMNRLLTKCRGSFIARMDADDIAFPNRIKKQVSFLQTNPEIGIVGSFMVEIDSSGNMQAARKVPIKHEQIVKNLLIAQTIQNPTLMIARGRVPDHQLYYNSQYSPVDDLDFLFRMSYYVKFANIPEYLMAYRKHTTNASLKNIKKTFSLTWKVRMKAISDYGYNTSSQIKLMALFQWLVVNLSPSNLLYSLFKLWKRDIVEKTKFVLPKAQRPSMRSFTLSLVMPVYRGGPYIRENIDRVIKHIRASHKTFELIVVDDGSGDNTYSICKELEKKYKELKVYGYKKNRGKGAAVRYGLNRSGYAYAGFIDSGSDIDLYSLQYMLSEIRNNPSKDAFVADKTHILSHVEEVPVMRKIYSLVFRNLVNFILGTNFSDTQAGLKIFKKSTIQYVLRRLPLRINGFAFDVELLSELARQKYSFHKCPAFITADIQKSTVKYSDIFGMVKDIFILSYIYFLQYLKFVFVQRRARA